MYDHNDRRDDRARNCRRGGKPVFGGKSPRIGMTISSVPTVNVQPVEQKTSASVCRRQLERVRRRSVVFGDMRQKLVRSPESRPAIAYAGPGLSAAPGPQAPSSRRFSPLAISSADRRLGRTPSSVKPVIRRSHRTYRDTVCADTADRSGLAAAADGHLVPDGEISITWRESGCRCRQMGRRRPCSLRRRSNIIGMMLNTGGYRRSTRQY